MRLQGNALLSSPPFYKGGIRGGNVSIFFLFFVGQNVLGFWDPLAGVENDEGA